MAEEYVIVDKTDLETIADSVREKSSTTDKYSVAALAEAIANTIVPPLPTDNPGNKQLVTDSTGKAKWIDQYCSVAKSVTTVLEEQTFDFSTDQHLSIPIQGGKEHEVSVDGIKYTLTASDSIDMGEIVVPPKISPEDGSFTITDYYISFKDGGVHTIGITTITESISTLDDKFIPDSVARTADMLWDTLSGRPSIESGDADYSIQEGRSTAASGAQSHAEGMSAHAYGAQSHAEGLLTTASGEDSHAEGRNTTASGKDSHAEGSDRDSSGLMKNLRIVTSDIIPDLSSELRMIGSMAYGMASHAEGAQTLAYGYSSHAEGEDTIASGSNSHAEGLLTIASGSNSHAEGSYTTASGEDSHAEGMGTTASSYRQHVQGKYNIEDSNSIYAHIVGNGTSDSDRSNAHTLDWSGNAWYAGTVEGTAMIVKSSTKGSTKRFKITVDDSGTISATEITT